MKTTQQLRQLFLDFFQKQGHTLVPSSSLVPKNDPSLMFTNSGMIQFKDVFVGKESLPFTRATSSQKCVRAGGKHNDLENVGYTKRHLTFFEMLGNFSFGDYFKEEAISYAWKFIVQELGLSPAKLYLTVYHSDDEAYSLWKKISGFDDNKIIRITTNDNFWAMGDTGPCGPCTEIFYDQGEHIQGGLPGTENQDGDRFVEIWNLVFMQFERLKSQELIALPKKCVDTGMGLERLAGVVQGVFDNFKTDILATIIDKIEHLTHKNAENSTAHRVIADHIRSSAFLIADGVTPSNEGRGYVLRRIIRRALRYVTHLDYQKPLLHKLIPVLVDNMGEAYPEIARSQSIIEETLQSEETVFSRTLANGLELLKTETDKLNRGRILPGEIAFKLHDTYGFPIDITQDILKEKGLLIDMEGFERSMATQKKMAKDAWQGSGDESIKKLWFDVRDKSGLSEFLGYQETNTSGIVTALVQNNMMVNRIENDNEFYLVTDRTPFYGEAGGQIGDVGTISAKTMEIEVIDTLKPLPGLTIHKCILRKGIIEVGATVSLTVNNEYRDGLRRNHTATHLLHAALKNKLSQQVVQKGSLVAHDRLRFDFSYQSAIPRSILDEIETSINSIILKNSDVVTKLMDKEEAINSGASALFGEKYEEHVRVVFINDEQSQYSIELCGGTHVKRSGDIGTFKILSDSAVAAGIRRIEAITGHEALKLFQSNANLIKELSSNLQAKEGDVLERVNDVLEDNKRMQKEVDKANQRNLHDVLAQAPKVVISKAELLMHTFTDADVSILRNLAQQYAASHKNSVVILYNNLANKQATITCSVGSDLHQFIDAKQIMNELSQKCHVKGGGNASLSNGTCSIEFIDCAIQAIKSFLALTLN